MSKTEVRFCNCYHPGQDRLYGVQRRVHNQGVKGWKCTVCTAITGSTTVVMGGKVKKK